jgi:hypothetical protein
MSKSTIIKCLEDAVKNEDQVAAVEYPLFRIPVDTKPMKPKKKLWEFSTNNRRIRAYVHQPDEVKSRFEKVVKKLYETAYANVTSPQSQNFLSTILGSKAKNPEIVNALAFHNFLSLIIHEKFHSIYWPDSNEDKKLTHQALFDGIRKAEPHLNASDWVKKTKNVENTMWDFGIDTFQYYFLSQNPKFTDTIADVLRKSGYDIDTHAIESMPDGVIPIFDVVSYAKSKKFPPSCLAMTRYIYSLLFCADKETRTNLLAYFGEKIVNGGTSVRDIDHYVTDALKGLVAEIPAATLKEMNIDKKKYNAAVDELYINKANDNYDNKFVIETMAAVMMDKETRYDAVRGFIQPLSKLISSVRYESRQGEEQGGDEAGDDSQSEPQSSPADALDNIMDGMDEQDAEDMLNSIINENSPHPGNGDPQMHILAADKYYKDHAPEIQLKSPDSKAQTVSLGKEKHWAYDFSIKVPVTELHKHKKWIDIGLRMGLPVLFETVKGAFYQVNYFKQVETDEKSYSFESTGIDVPRNWIMINDSSGTMGDGHPGSGSRWDALQMIEYGLMKGVISAAKQADNKETDLWTVNFSSQTYAAGPIPLEQFYNSRSGKAKEVQLIPQRNCTTLDTDIFPTIRKQLGDGRTVWSFITDGAIDNSTPVYNWIDKLLDMDDTSVLFFQVFQKTPLGNQLEALKQRKHNLHYKYLDNMNSIMQSSFDVLVQYDRMRWAQKGAF